jgi:DNA-binding Lrp family transcriptional regulator
VLKWQVGSKTVAVDLRGKGKGSDIMAVKVFVLIETTMGKTREVVNVLEEINGVKSVDAVTGLYDVIAVVEMPDMNTVGDLMTKRIHSVSGVARTITCITARLGESSVGDV